MIDLLELPGSNEKEDKELPIIRDMLRNKYGEIKELSIAELLRPNNSLVVGVRRYHWNGHVKEYIFKEENDYDYSGIF